MANKKLSSLLRHDCIICHKKINKPKDQYVRLTDFAGKMQTGECFYHLECWKNKNKIRQENAMKMVQPMTDKLVQNLQNLQGVKNEQ